MFGLVLMIIEIEMTVYSRGSFSDGETFKGGVGFLELGVRFIQREVSHRS